MVVDIILLLIIAAIFYAGFRCGAKYKTLRDFWTAAKAKAKSLFS